MKEIPCDVIDLLDYDKQTGLFTWKKYDKYHPYLYKSCAGTIRDGRIVIKINGTAYYAHRIAWFIEYGEQPNIIDHINGDVFDNRIVNLRNVSHYENAKNHGKIINKSNLSCGVRKTEKGRFQARVTCNKIVYHLGVFDTEECARNAYLEKRNQLFNEFERKNNASIIS